MTQQFDPIQVAYTRGDTVENIHAVIAVRATVDGVTNAYGDVSQPVYPRSAFKPFQALAVISSGAAQAFGLKTHQLALAMASHSGEPRHAEAVMAWLKELGLDEGALHCGAHSPMWEKATADIYRHGEEPSARHHNCSGKHSGMLTLMRHLDAPPNYEDYQHPVQVEIRALASRFLGIDLTDVPWSRDGCAVPNYAMPLGALAVGYARLASPPDDLADACSQLLTAWAERPDLVAGSGRFDTAVMLASDSAILSKVGADGVQAALIPSTGVAFAVKALDGARQAAEQAMAELLAKEGALNLTSFVLIKHWKPSNRALKNFRGDVIGEVAVNLPS